MPREKRKSKEETRVASKAESSISDIIAGCNRSHKSSLKELWGSMRFPTLAQRQSCDSKPLQNHIADSLFQFRKALHSVCVCVCEFWQRGDYNQELGFGVLFYLWFQRTCRFESEIGKAVCPGMIDPQLYIASPKHKSCCVESWTWQGKAPA